MNCKSFTLILTLLFLVSSCDEAGNLMGGIVVKVNDNQKPSIASVKVQNHQLIVTGKNLDAVTLAKIEGSTNHQFQIESKTSDKLVLNAKSALNFLVGGALNLVVSNATAAATFPVSFELQNGQVTASKLHHMGASTGDFLQFNGSNWVPASISSSQVYVGTYDANTDTPDIVAAGGTSGTYYIVTVAGDQNLGSGMTHFDVGDWIIYNGSSWSKVSVGMNTVSNFNGRTGAVVPLADDYSWSMLTKAAGKLTGSKLQEIADVDVAGIQDGDILQWNVGNSKWEVTAVPAPAIAAGSITNTQIASGAIDSTKIVDGSIVNADIAAGAAIDQAKINGLTAALDSKEATINTGSASQFWNGNKTWQDLNPAVIGSVLTGFSSTTGAITATDSIISAIGKLSGNLGVTAASQANYVLKAGDTMSGPLAMGNNKITGLATPTVGTDAATMAYVDSKVSAAPGDNLGNHTATANLVLGNNDITGVNKIYLADGAWNSPSYSFSNSTNTGLYYGGSNIGFSVNGGLAMNLSPAVLQMNGTYGGYIRGTGSNDATAPTYAFGGDGNTGMFSLATDILGFSTNGVEKMRILATGEMAIGKTSANGLLDVAGNVALDGILKIKSDNTSYVEFRAPASLGATTTYTFPSTAGTAGYALTTNGAGVLSWTDVASSASTVGGDVSGTIANAQIVANAVGTSEIADGSVTYVKLSLADGEIPLTKLNGASDATKYLKGDKSWGTFLTDVLAATFATVTPSNTVISNGDSLQTVVNKTQGQINQLKTDSSSYLIKNGTDSITGAVSVVGAGTLKIPTTPSGADLTDVANVQYVQNYLNIFGKWTKTGADISYSAGNVGIGTASPRQILDVAPAAGNSIIRATSTNGTTALQLYRNTAGSYTGPVLWSNGGDLNFGYDSSENAGPTLMTLTTAGALGIGTTTPFGKLDVANTETFQTNGIGANTYLRNSSSANGDYLAIGWLAEDTWGIMSADGLTHRNLVFQAAGGNVGIGTTTPDQKLDVTHTAGSYGQAGIISQRPDSSDTIGLGIYNPTQKWDLVNIISSGTDYFGIRDVTQSTNPFAITTAGNVGIGTTNPLYKLEVVGTIRGFGITDSSDARLKNTIVPLRAEEDLAKVLRLNSVSYFWNNNEHDKDKQIGFIAQEMEKVYPELVETDKTGMKSVNYSHLVSPITSAIKALYQRIVGQETQVKTLKREIASLKEQNVMLMKQNELFEKRLNALEKKDAKKKGP